MSRGFEFLITFRNSLDAGKYMFALDERSCAARLRRAVRTVNTTNCDEMTLMMLSCGTTIVCHFVLARLSTAPVVLYTLPCHACLKPGTS